MPPRPTYAKAPAMYPTAQTATATPGTANALWLASLCARPKVAAPYTGKRCAPARSMVQACIAAGLSIAATQATLNANGARALARVPLIWP